MELNILAIQHNTDKSTVKHGFTLSYERHFKDLKEMSFTMIEIGVASGASIKMWSDYFPKAQIVGVDIDESCKKFETDRIKIRIGDQTDKKFLENLIEEFPNPLIIIDDGGHTMTQQIFSFEVLFPFLAEGGTYVIEDLHTSYLEEHRKEKYKGMTAIDYIKGLVDTINVNGKLLDRCIGHKPL